MARSIIGVPLGKNKPKKVNLCLNKPSKIDIKIKGIAILNVIIIWDVKVKLNGIKPIKLKNKTK